MNFEILIFIDAVLRNIEIIGEANHVSEKTRVTYSHIPWKKIVGLRNIVIHEYFGIDLENIWIIITENIPQVKQHFLEMRLKI